jgi:beta-lactamase class A
MRWLHRPSNLIREPSNQIHEMLARRIDREARIGNAPQHKSMQHKSIRKKESPDLVDPNADIGTGRNPSRSMLVLAQIVGGLNWKNAGSASPNGASSFGKK